MTEPTEESAVLVPSIDGSPPMYRFPSELTADDVNELMAEQIAEPGVIDRTDALAYFDNQAEAAPLRSDWQSSELMALGPITPPTMPRPVLPEDDATRASYPMADGCLDYFPNALAEVSKISFEGNLKHNPGEPMHWNRGKSLDHRNKIIRHTVESKTDCEASIYHAAQAAWRSLAHLQELVERVRGAPMSPGSRPA